MATAASSQNPARVTPIRETEYALIVQTAQTARPEETPQQAVMRAATDIAAIGLMRDGLLRLREAVEARWCDLSSAQVGSGMLTITVSKEGLGCVIYVSPRTMNALAEMRSIKLATGIDIENDDRIFQMGSQQLGRRIRNACAFTGLEGRYGGSSPRIGMTIDLVRAGTSAVDLMAAARRKIHVSEGAVAQWHARNQSTHTPA